MIPVTIMTGFLGSGKTTLLVSLIQGRQARRLALLINEFGEVSIDGALIHDSFDRHDPVTIHDFPDGLIAYGDDQRFIPAMKAIAERRAQIDHVLIETSGVALPTAIMERLQSPELAGEFVLDATLVVVDTPLLLSDQFERDQAGHPGADSVATLFEQQLEFADVVVLNKIDGLDEDALLLAEARLRKRAPNLRFIELAYHARLEIRLALGLRLHQATLAANRHHFTPVAMPGTEAALFLDQSRMNGHAHSGLGRHSHGIATHKHFHEQDPGWLSFVLRSQEPQQPEILKAALIDAARTEPILRIKGFVRATGPGQDFLVQGVRTRVTISTGVVNKSSPESEVVFIGYHPSRNNVATLLSGLTGTLWR